ncbi:hypothetical protein BV25DRAFT_173677 [Artomyces pyxidatus]|uniref:Uncharacterized protein n=1 Tax=Artomyces pyxidatus TaxID=48021 RepID=A0ACB8SGT3_9AGAM|nr:hypothetical protein BV25DRAFT_173677 [Artomyces pyxidatus]
MGSKSPLKITAGMIREAQKAVITRGQLKYLPPQRRLAGRTLPRIPNEIYLEIFDYIQPSESFSGTECKAMLICLTSVCHYFRTICLPRRLRNLTITASQKNHVDFIDGFRKYPFPVYNVPPYVLALSFKEWIPPSQPDAWVYEALLQKHTNALCGFRNLRELSLHRVPISREFFDNIGLQFSLEDVSITSCVFGPFHDSDTMNPEPPITPWTKLEFCDNQGYEPYLGHLATYAASPGLSMLSSTSWDVVHAIISGCDDSRIESLSTPLIPNQDPDHLPSPGPVLCVARLKFLRDFFVRNPALEVLELNQMSHLDSLPITHRFGLPSDALPRLKNLKCPSFFLEELVQGRPIERVDIPGRLEVGLLGRHQRWADVLAALKTSSMPIQWLSLNDEVLAEAHCLSSLTHLRSLTLYSSYPILSDGRRAETIHPTVRTVNLYAADFGRDRQRGSLVPYDLRRERQRVLALVMPSRFPQATIVSFHKQIEWRKGGYTWIPVVVNRDQVKNDLIKAAERWSSSEAWVGEGLKWDDGGCVRQLFREDEMTPVLHRLFADQD